MKPPPPRPFTEYILFYQLERAYILQNLGVVPSLKEEETFAVSDPSYNGPELPARYRGVVLSKDWHTPKKINKKKRQHRASHGKISFADLSKAVSASWRNAERDVKLFCAELARIQVRRYKEEMREYTYLAQSKLLVPINTVETKESDSEKETFSEQGKLEARESRPADITPATSPVPTTMVLDRNPSSNVVGLCAETVPEQVASKPPVPHPFLCAMCGPDEVDLTDSAISSMWTDFS